MEGTVNLRVDLKISEFSQQNISKLVNEWYLKNYIFNKKHSNSISAAKFNFKNTILIKNIYKISFLKL